MSTIVLKTARRKSAISRQEVRKVVEAIFISGTFHIKAAPEKKAIKKATGIKAVA